MTKSELTLKIAELNPHLYQRDAADAGLRLRILITLREG